MLQNINKLFTWSRFPRIPQLPHAVLNLRNIFSYRHRPTRELLSLIYSCGIYSIPKSHLYIWHIFIHCLKTNKNQLNFWQTLPPPPTPPHISRTQRTVCLSSADPDTKNHVKIQFRHQTDAVWHPQKFRASIPDVTALTDISVICCQHFEALSIAACLTGYAPSFPVRGL